MEVALLPITLFVIGFGWGQWFLPCSVHCLYICIDFLINSCYFCHVLANTVTHLLLAPYLLSTVWRRLTGLNLSFQESCIQFSFLPFPRPTLHQSSSAVLKCFGKKPGTSHVTEQELERRPLGETLQICFLRPCQLLFGELIVFQISI